MRPALLLTLLLAGTPAAAQPYSQSLAQCGALYALMSDWVDHPENSTRLAHASVVFAQAATLRAGTEGVADPAVASQAQAAEKRAEWVQNGKLWIFTEEFRDWTRYCRAFARDRGLDIDPD
jgi:hypothetical protein